MWITVQDKLINLDHVSAVTLSGKNVVLGYGYFGVNKSQDLISGVVDNAHFISDTIKCENETVAKSVFSEISAQLNPVKIQM
jgi:hypothetical protein